MKKVYINPAINIVEMQAVQMVMSSTVGVSSSNYDEGMTDLGRASDFWDDDAE